MPDLHKSKDYFIALGRPSQKELLDLARKAYEKSASEIDKEIKILHDDSERLAEQESRKTSIILTEAIKHFFKK